MQANEIFSKIHAMGGVLPPETVDTVKAGDPAREVRRLAVCFIATVQVLRDAAEWGADMLLTHEPTYYTNDDTADTDEITRAKQALVAETGMVICRFHDGIHRAARDGIVDGIVTAAKLDGTFTDSTHLTLKQAITPRALAKQLEERCGLRHIRIVGAADTPLKKLALPIGAPWGETILHDFKTGNAECVLTGEVCEWSIGEYVRDAAEFGKPMAMLILGHAGSERDGMKLLSERLSGAFPAVETRYFECGEVYL